MGRKVIDIAGKQFGEWQVIRPTSKRIDGNAAWWCKCACGIEQEVNSRYLRSGASLRCLVCSCKRSFAARRAAGTHPVNPLTHGQSRAGKVSLEYRSYSNTRQLCTNRKHRDFPRYGGRGVKFLFESFEQFFAEVGERPEPKNMYGIDLINGLGNYEPGNVRWSPSRDKRLNQRTITEEITHAA